MDDKHEIKLPNGSTISGYPSSSAVGRSRSADSLWIINPYTGEIPPDMFFVSEWSLSNEQPNA